MDAPAPVGSARNSITIPDMDFRDEHQFLRDAQAKAQRLMDRLIAQRDDLERSGLALAPDKLALGKTAFAEAIRSTQKTLQEIEHALQD